MRNLFVAVSTDQNVANLPPILQYAGRGDWVIWLESEEARNECWRWGSEKVLHRRGIISNGHPLGDFMNPREVGECAYNAVRQHLNRGPATVYFVMNGGTKLMPLGLTLAGKALENAPVAVRYLYSNPRPVVLFSYEHPIESNAPWRIRYHHARMLSLPEIAMINERTIPEDDVRWQPGKPFPETPLRDKKRRNKGYLFEKEIFYTTLSFLHGFDRDGYVIKEVRWGPKIMNEKQVEAELDVAIVLNNGVVIDLECKSGRSQIPKQKMMFRLHIIREATSHLAQTYIVRPTGSRHPRWNIPEMVEVIQEEQFKARLREILSPFR